MAFVQIAPLEKARDVVQAPAIVQAERPWSRSRKAAFMIVAGLLAWGVVLAAAWLLYSLF